MNKSYFKHKVLFQFLHVLLFLVYIIWWLVIAFNHYNFFDSFYTVWGLTYWIVGFFPAIYGLVIANYFGFQDMQNKFIFCLSIGLLFQCIGQNIGTYYVMNHLDVYPSLADIAYIASHLSYIAAGFIYLRANEISIRLNIKLILIQYSILLFSSVIILFFIIDWTNRLRVFFDFFYPTIESVFLVAALTAFIKLQDKDAVIKNICILLLLAFTAQFLADYLFSVIYESDLWIGKGFSELFYIAAYFGMGYLIIEYINFIFYTQKLKIKNQTPY